MKDRKRIFYLVLIMVFVAIVAAGISITMLYNAAFDEERERLVETAQSRARLIEAIARFDAIYSHDYPEGPALATISQIVDAHEHFKGFGETGEFTLAKREGGQVVFILSHRHHDLDKPHPVAFGSSEAEPMQLALSGQSGSMVGLDYRGQTVLAAYEPVAILDLGIVAKIDVKEVRAPFVKAALAAGASALAILLGGSIIFLRISDPIVKRLHDYSGQLEKEVSERTSELEEANKALFDDMAARSKVEAAFRESERMHNEAQEIAHLGHWEHDFAKNKVSCSEESFRIFDMEPQRSGMTYEAFLDTVHPEDRAFVDKAYDDSIRNKTTYDVVHRLLMKDGSVKYVNKSCRIEYFKDGTPLRSLGTVQDITEHRQAEEKILHMAYHDPLTGLPNRSLLIDRIDQAFARAQRQKGLAAVLFLDLDRFKLINDTLGHVKGDEVIKAVAERLQKHIRKTDTLARQGGDEFTIITQDLKMVEDIAKVAEGVLSAFEDPFNYGGQEFSITVSMGISVYPNDGEDADTILKNADIAMYKAKDEGRNSYQLYSSSMNESVTKRLRLENKLRKAIKKEEFLLHYQPQVDTATGEVIGLEALVRWQEPQEGLISPGDFIPVAEDTGLIVPIGEWVMRTACAQNKLWQDEGYKHMAMAVNISMRQFKGKDFLSTVERILKETNLNPKHLELELTESIVMGDIKSTIEILHALRAMGVRLSIDDFGTGYSSLEYLKRMPIDMLKIDQSFVRDITLDPNDAAIAKATIQVAQSMNLEVIAEGVEAREQLMLLRDLQCSKIQGYLFSRPLPSHEIKEFLKKEWRFVVECIDLEGQRRSDISA